MAHYLTRTRHAWGRVGHTDEVEWNGVPSPIPDAPAVHCSLPDEDEDWLFDGHPMPPLSPTQRATIYWGKRAFQRALGR